MKIHYRIELPKNCQAIVLYHDKPVAVALQYATPPASAGTIYITRFEVRIPAGKRVEIVAAKGEFNVVKVAGGETPISTDPVTSIYSQPYP